MRAIFLSRDRLKLSIASAVGCRITRQRFLSKYALASGDNRTFPSWPAPTINTSQPSSKTNFASSFETMWEVPYFSFERRFRRFSTLPERRMITSCSEVFASIVTAPNSVASIRIVFSRIPSERRRFLGYGRGPQDSQRMGQRRDDLIRLAPIEFLLQQAEYSSRHSQRVAGERWGCRLQRGLQIQPVGVRRTAFPQCASRRRRSHAREAGVAPPGARPVPPSGDCARRAAPIATPCRRADDHRRRLHHRNGGLCD